MRILHISTRLILGGSQENTVLSCEGQARLGHDVHLAFGPIYGPEGSLLDRVRTFRTPDGRGITTHVVPHLIRAVNPLADWRSYRELTSLVRSLKPDIVHTHSSKAGILGRAAACEAAWPSAHSLFSTRFVAYGARRAINGSGPGIIHTIHGPPFMPVEGSPVQRAMVRINNTIYTLAERFAAKRCHTIVSVADAMTNQFLARGIGRPEQYVTVRSGMEIEPFLTPRSGETRGDMRKQLGLSPEDFVIGTVARLTQHKGHDDLLDALANDFKSANNPRMKLLWIGDGWWRERLIQKAHSLGLTVAELDKSEIRNLKSEIIFTGLVPPDRIPGLIRAMDILAHPSYREGLPRTVPQALLSNVCPVAYDVDGTGEICRDMQTGRLVPLADRAKLRDAILWLRDHPRERGEMASRGRDECRVAFSAETMVNQLEQVYARALDLARQS
jgi:glycosyltransferase involved in cell wall biosynthesis